ncbi:MAG: hypothetical protein ACRD6W_04360, partial [Nitrososphaerales archaeon]
TGSVSLTPFDIPTQNGLPQFLITLNNPAGGIGQVEVKLVWSGTYSPQCAPSTGIVLAPPSGSQTVGQNYTLTATAQYNGAPVAGTTVTFTDTSGPNVGKTVMGTTNSTGAATATYTSAAMGNDSWKATFVDKNGQTQTSNIAVVMWNPVAATTTTTSATTTTTSSTTTTTSQPNGQPTRLRTTLSSGHGCDDQWDQGCADGDPGCGGARGRGCGGDGQGRGDRALEVPPGTPVVDSATLSGVNASSATGTVTYNVYSDSACTVMASPGTSEALTTPGTLPRSNPVTLSTPGTFYWQASYSGDGANASSVSKCGSEVETVKRAQTQITTLLVGSGIFNGGSCWWLGDVITVYSGSSVSDSATLSTCLETSAGMRGS